MEQDKRQFTMAFRLPSPTEPHVDDRAFLLSLCNFGVFLRLRIAKALLESWQKYESIEALRISISLGIWEQLGAQVEDLLMFLVTVPKWVLSGRSNRLADLYFETQIRATGDTSPVGISISLSKQTDTDFLKSLGLPIDPNSWPDKIDSETIKAQRTKIAVLLTDQSEIIRSVLNKLKHGPQMILSPIDSRLPDPYKDMRVAKLLLKGAKLAMTNPKVEPTHLCIEDSGDHIPLAVDQIALISRLIWLLASYVYYFSFGKFAHIVEKDKRFQPPEYWISRSRFSDEIDLIW